MDRTLAAESHQEPLMSKSSIVIPVILSQLFTACIFEPRCWETATCPIIEDASTTDAGVQGDAIAPTESAAVDAATAGGGASSEASGVTEAGSAAASSALDASTASSASTPSTAPPSSSTTPPTASDAGLGDAASSAADSAAETPVSDVPAITRFLSSETTLPGGGGSVNLSWQVTGADAVTIEPGVGDVTDPESGTIAVEVTETTTFTLTATNAAGDVTATRSVEVTSQGILDWTRQFGTALRDGSYGVTCTLTGDVFITGGTDGVLDDDDHPNAGVYDLFLAGYQPDGTQLWTRQLGTAEADYGYRISANHLDELFVAGSTAGAFVPGAPYAGTPDSALVGFSKTGSILWKEQLGTAGAEGPVAISTDAEGNLYVAGSTNGDFAVPEAIPPSPSPGAVPFVAKYSPSLEQEWIITGTDPGLYVVSATGAGGDTILAEGREGGARVLVTKLSSAGQKVWSQEFSSGTEELVRHVAIDGLGNAFVVGDTYGVLADDFDSNDSGDDLFIVKYSPEGALLWARQFGDDSGATAQGATTDRNGNVYIVGLTEGNLDGNHPDSITDDVVVAKYSPDGEQLWLRQYGTAADERATAVAADAQGYVYVTGYTAGDLFGTNAGEDDAFLFRLR
jgi:Beta-propeller repeat